MVVFSHHQGIAVSFLLNMGSKAHGCMKLYVSIFASLTLLLSAGCTGTLFDDSESYYNKDISIEVTGVTPDQGSTVLSGTAISITSDYLIDGWYSNCYMSLNLYGRGKDLCQ